MIRTLDANSNLDVNSKGRDTAMTSSVVKRITVFLFVITMFLSVTAYADGPIEILAVDQSTGTGTLLGRVLVDNVKQPGFVNLNGDGNPAVGTIQWHGVVGNFYVYLDGTTSTGSGGTALTLAGDVQYQGTGGDNIILEIVDTGLTPPSPTVTLSNFLGGYYYPTNTLTGGGPFPASVNLITFDSFLDAANSVPAFGTTASTGGAVTLNASALNIPGTNFIAGTADLSAVSNYSLTSRVAIDFTGSGGEANFSWAADTSPASAGTSVPEPTSLLLLGSSLLGVGVLQGKKRR